jgi:hypothetical protein
MAKVTFTPIESGTQAWDATLNDDLDLIFGAPLPLFEGSTPTASQNDRGIMAVNDGTAGWSIQISDGANWKYIAKRAVTTTAFSDSIGGTVADALAAIPDPADSPASADALRDDLVTNTLPKIRNALSSLAAKWNTFRTNGRASGLMA